MKKTLVLVIVLMALVPGFALATPANGQGAADTTSGSTTSSNAATSTSTATNTSTTNAGDTTQLQTESMVQTQNNNPGTGTMTQTQAEERTQEQIAESKSQYTPANADAANRLEKVSTAAEELIRVSNRISNTSVGTQIRTIAEEQIGNQDKMNQSIDKAESRSAIAKFFIGSNYKEIKAAKQIMVQNQERISSLQQLMAQVEGDADKLQIAAQIITLQAETIAFRDQLDVTDNGFSLFGWLSRWIAGY